MFMWPSHFPPQCPPSGAANVSGEIFRFISGRTPTVKDFVSHYERDPEKEWGQADCISRGLSVLRTLEDCSVMRKGIPAMRKKKIAVGSSIDGHGVIAGTPSMNCEGHCTWWRSTPPESVVGLFSTVSEAAGN